MALQFIWQWLWHRSSTAFCSFFGSIFYAEIQSANLRMLYYTINTVYMIYKRITLYKFSFKIQCQQYLAVITTESLQSPCTGHFLQIIQREKTISAQFLQKSVSEMMGSKNKFKKIILFIECAELLEESDITIKLILHYYNRNCILFP